MSLKKKNGCNVPIQVKETDNKKAITHSRMFIRTAQWNSPEKEMYRERERERDWLKDRSIDH